MTLLTVQKNVQQLCQRAVKESPTNIALKLHELTGSTLEQRKKILLETAKLHKNVEAGIEALDAKIKALQEQKQPLVVIQSFIKDWALETMQTNDIDEAECLEARIKLCKSPVSVIIENENRLPEMFVELVRKPVKKMIKEALEAGEQVSGAKLENGKQYVKIS